MMSSSLILNYYFPPPNGVVNDFRAVNCKYCLISSFFFTFYFILFDIPHFTCTIFLAKTPKSDELANGKEEGGQI